MRKINGARLGILTAGVIALAAAGCGTSPTSGNEIDFEDQGQEGVGTSQAALVVPTEVDTVRVYVDDTNHLVVTDDVPWIYGLFELTPGARVRISLAVENGTTGGAGFKLYRVSPFTKKLIYLGSFERPVRLISVFGGSYVVEAVANEHPGYLALDLTCLNHHGRCTPLAQPGELCGSRGLLPCDDGLYCHWQIEDQCGAADQPGVCARMPQECPLVFWCQGLIGCDGNSYCSECDAAFNGTSIACNPHDWGKPEMLPPAEAFVGMWRYYGTQGMYNVTATLTLNSDATFVYTQDWAPQCLTADPPCKVANRFFSMTGTYEVTLGNGLVLNPSEPPPAELATSFTVEVNCADEVRLSTTELGQDEIFVKTCDPEAYGKPTELSAQDVNGQWTWSGERNGKWVVGNLTLDAALGTFTFEEAVAPLCTQATPPCMAPVVLHQTSGTFVAELGMGVQLYPVVSDPIMAEAFGVRANCLGDLRLETTEEWLDEIWTRVQVQ